MNKALNFTFVCVALIAAPWPAVASGSRDDNRNGSQQQTNNQSNSQTNNQTATATTGSNVNTVNISTANVPGGLNSVSTSNTNNYIGYPDWINVAPSQSGVSVDSVTCQGPTLTATASTLTTNSYSNQYGVQGAIGFSVPIGGQADCNAVQAAIRKRAVVENSVRLALACKQLEASGIQVDAEKFPDLAICVSR
jgi:hypothetical protein